jgi:hypothetical protein
MKLSNVWKSSTAKGESMSVTRGMIPFAGLLATIGVSGYMVVQLDAQGQTPSGDFTKAMTAEVRDAQGAVVLSGSFAATNDADDDEVERKATLAPTAVGADARGKAEIEFAKTSPVAQELEFSVRNLQPNSTVTFVIDGVDIATATTDKRGRTEVEWKVPLAGTTAAR